MFGSSEKVADGAGDLNEEVIVDRIYQAVIEQRLPPGTKLSESALCKAFNVGRMRIRRSLLLLASRNIVDLQSNRGAYVSSPTSAEAREVFEARRCIEPNVARAAVERATAADIETLEEHLGWESAAHRQGDRQQVIRLSGEFHVKLAEVARNHIMHRMVKELVTRTSLIIGLFGAPGTANCHDDEHADIISALKQRDQDQVAQIMTHHLQHIETQIDLTARRNAGVDLTNVFSDE
ncbi:MAG: GntR family transcriptional regulator [Alphaproteobacteria bacterium]|nr:GntR family transcriptional regulator [Alphaproteobacteria bacterium]